MGELGDWKADDHVMSLWFSCQTHWREKDNVISSSQLVFESPVRSGYFALVALTETETG